MFCWQLARITLNCWHAQMYPLLQKIVRPWFSFARCCATWHIGRTGTGFVALFAKLRNVCLHCAGGGALGQGDLPLDGLCARVNQQLPLFVLRRRRFVRRSWHPSGAPILCNYVCSLDDCFCFLRPWQI